jgi:nitrite reductase (NADH) large subunit
MKRHIIIGNSAAGIGALQKLRMLDPHSHIICISEELELPYNKCFLADYLSGAKAESAVYTKNTDFFKAADIELLLGTRVISIDPQAKQLAVVNAGSPDQTPKMLAYDTLLLATGSSPKLAAFFNPALMGVFTFHTLNDTHAIQHFISQHSPQRAVVIGSGLSGLECADSLRMQGIQVTVIIRSGILRNLINIDGAQLIEKLMEQSGISIVKHEEVEELLENKQRVNGVRLKNGAEIATDMVIVATGLKPNSEIAKTAGLMIHEGIVTNDFLQTNDLSIWAAGDCTEVTNQLTGERVLSTTWPDAMQQGMKAEHNMAGTAKKYAGIVPIISSQFFGINLVTCGPINLPPSSYELIIKKGDGFCHAFLVEKDLLKGFMLVGHTGNWPRYKRAMLIRESFSVFLSHQFVD